MSQWRRPPRMMGMVPGALFERTNGNKLYMRHVPNYDDTNDLYVGHGPAMIIATLFQSRKLGYWVYIIPCVGKLGWVQPWEDDKVLCPA